MHAPPFTSFRTISCLVALTLTLAATAPGQTGPTYRGQFVNHVVTVIWSGFLDTPPIAIQTNTYTQSSISIPLSQQAPNYYWTNLSLQGTLDLSFPLTTPEGTIDEFQTISFTSGLQRGASFSGQWQCPSNAPGWQINSQLGLDDTIYCPDANQTIGPGLSPNGYPVTLSRDCAKDFIPFPAAVGSDLLYEIDTSLETYVYAPSNPPAARILFGLSVEVKTFYRVSTAGGMELDVNQLLFQVQGTNPPPQLIEVNNNGTSNLTFAVAVATADGGNWLTATPTGGTLAPNQTTNLTVAVTADALPPDLTNTATVSVSGNAANSPQTVQVQVAQTLARLIGLEVNQVVQDWSNSVPLIAGKVTTVRAHLQCAGSQPVPWTAQLHGYRDGAEILPPLTPFNPGGRILASPAADVRQFLNSSLNFELPTDWTTGTVTLQLDTNGVICAEAAGTPNDCAVTVTFQPPVLPKIKLLNVPWVDANGVTHSCSFEAMRDLIPRLISCYPVTNVDYRLGQMAWDLQGQPDLNRLLHRLSARRNADAATKANLGIYYGVVASDIVEGLAFVPGDVGCGRLGLNRFGDGRHTHSHEIAHNLGRDHAPYCGATLTYTTTPAFPYVADFGGVNHPTLGPLFDGPNALVYGYDHDAGEIVSPYQYFDLMSYCRGGPLELWPSEYTYEALIPALTNRFGSPPSGGSKAARDYLFVGGAIDPVSDAVSLDPLVTLTFNHDPDFPPPGEYSVRLLDGVGQLIQSVSFAPSVVVADPSGQTSTSFLVPVLQNPAFRQVQVVHNNLVRASRSASAHPPTVQVLFPRGGEDLTGDSVNINWAGSDPDGDPLTYLVQYSPDNGTTWETLDVDLTSTNYLVPRQVLQGTSTGRVRVIACDGFFTATGTSAGTFTTANNAPEILIRSPATGTLFFGNQQLVLTALAYDPEDGVLDGTNIVWSSDLDGPLGSGSRLYTTAAALREGTHLVSATALDSGGLTASAQVNLVVQRTVPPSVADLAVSQTSQVTTTGLTFTVTVQSLGPSDATGLKLTESLPPGATVLAATSTLGVCTVTNGLLTCAISQLPLGESAVVTLQLAIVAAGAYTNVADVRGVEVDPVVANNLAEEVASFTPAPPQLHMALTGNTVTISWPATTPSNVVLQTSARLYPALWSDVTDTPASVNGRLQVTQSIASQSRYYRLLRR